MPAVPYQSGELHSLRHLIESHPLCLFIVLLCILLTLVRKRHLVKSGLAMCKQKAEVLRLWGQMALVAAQRSGLFLQRFLQLGPGVSPGKADLAAAPVGHLSGRAGAELGQGRAGGHLNFRTARRGLLGHVDGHDLRSSGGQGWQKEESRVEQARA